MVAAKLANLEQGQRQSGQLAAVLVFVMDLDGIGYIYCQPELLWSPCR